MADGYNLLGNRLVASIVCKSFELCYIIFQNIIFLCDFLYPVDAVSLSCFCWIHTTYMVYISSGMSWRALWATLYKTQF
jgi:hypothetical protein